MKMWDVQMWKYEKCKENEMEEFILCGSLEFFCGTL